MCFQELERVWVSSVPSMSKNKIFLLFIMVSLFFFVITDRKKFLLVLSVLSDRFRALTRMPFKFYLAFHRDDQAFASVNDAGFYQVCTVWCYVDHNVRGFNLEFSGVGDVGGYQGRFFSCSQFILFIKVLKLVVFHAAFFKEAFHFGFSENNWFRFILLGFDEIVKFLVDLKDCVICAVIHQGFLLPGR